MNPQKVAASCAKGMFDEPQIFRGRTVYYNLEVSVGSGKVVFALALNCSVDFSVFGMSFYPRENRDFIGDEGLEKIKDIMQPLGFYLDRKREGDRGSYQKLKWWKGISPCSDGDVIDAMNDALQKIGNARTRIEAELKC